MAIGDAVLREDKPLDACGMPHRVDICCTITFIICCLHQKRAGQFVQYMALRNSAAMFVQTRRLLLIFSARPADVTCE